MAKQRKKASSSNGHEDRQDALAILTDDQLRAGLDRRKRLLADRLADLYVDEMMPGWGQGGEDIEAHERLKALLRDGIAEVDRRLKGASELLREITPSKIAIEEPIE